jgi:hypothetical protein
VDLVQQATDLDARVDLNLVQGITMQLSERPLLDRLAGDHRRHRCRGVPRLAALLHRTPRVTATVVVGRTQLLLLHRTLLRRTKGTSC